MGPYGIGKNKMAEEKPRLARLTAIITQLQSKKLVTANDIAEKHGVSIRTVYRDIRTLEKSGIPIVTEEGRGYTLVDGYKLPPVMFTEEEAMALITTEQLIQKNKDESLSQNYENAIIKIKSTLGYNQKTKTELLAKRLQVRDNSKEEKTSQYLIQLQYNIVNFQLIEIDYLSLNNQRSQRKIEPFALYTTKENWVLIAFCRKKQDFRAFRLDCIQRIKVTNDKFEPHKITLEQYLENCRTKWESTPDIPLSPSPSTFVENNNSDFMQKVKVDAFHLIGLAIRTTNADGQAAREIGELWGKFISENILERIPNKVDSTIYSLYTDYQGDHTDPYTAILGCKVTGLDDIPEDMVGRSFQGGDYVKTTAKGDLMQGLVLKEWTRIFELELERAYVADFEVFGEKAQNPSAAEVDFYIGVKTN